MDVLPSIQHVLWVPGHDLTCMGHNQYTRILSIQVSEHPSCGTRWFVMNCKITISFSDWCMLVHGGQHAMDRLPPIQHVLWVNGQGLTDMGHNQYNSNLSTWASEYQRGGTGFGENYRTTKPSSWLSMLLREGPHAMNVLPLTPHILWVHLQGLTSLEDSKYTGMLSAQTHQEPKLWHQIWWEPQNNNAILRLLYVVTLRTACKERVTNHSTILWVHEQGLASLGCNQYNSILLFIWASEHPSCDTILCENCKTTRPSSWLSMVLIEDAYIMNGFPGHFAKYSICLMSVWERCNKPEDNKYTGALSI